MMTSGGFGGNNCNCLWAVNNCGQIFIYNIKEHGQWHQLVTYQNGLSGFKRVSCAPRSTWAVGGDHQIYVYVLADDIPIRVCAVTYENHRWNPVTNFTAILLPTDRPPFSSEDGTDSQPKESFKMPSRSWQWESDWY